MKNVTLGTRAGNLTNMTGLLAILRYMLCWNRILGWLVAMGLVALLLVPAIALLLDNRTATGVLIYAYGAALGLPWLAATVPFRHLVSSRRLAMVPGMQVRAGRVLLMFTLLAAFFLPLCTALLWPDFLHPLFGSSLFIGGSLFTLLMQWAITSPLVILLMSFGPFVVFFFLFRIGPLLAPFFFDPAIHMALFALCLAGWFIALRILAHKRNFAPVFRTPFNNTDYLWGGTGWGYFTRPSRSSMGTLLLAYPDGIANRLYYTLQIVVISPFVGVLCIWLIGFPNGWNNRPEISNLYLLFSMIAAIIISLGNGELAARCRLIWIRQAGSRQQQWKLLESTLFTSLGLLWLTVALSTVVVVIFFETSGSIATDYLLITISCTLLGSYFSLMARISNWPMPLHVLMVLVMGPGVALAIIQEAVPLPALASGIVLAALLFRGHARRRFSSIDWFVVKPRCHPLHVTNSQ